MSTTFDFNPFEIAPEEMPLQLSTEFVLEKFRAEWFVGGYEHGTAAAPFSMI